MNIPKDFFDMAIRVGVVADCLQAHMKRTPHFEIQRKTKGRDGEFIKWWYTYAHFYCWEYAVEVLKDLKKRKDGYQYRIKETTWRAKKKEQKR